MDANWNAVLTPMLIALVGAGVVYVTNALSNRSLKLALTNLALSAKVAEELRRTQAAQLANIEVLALERQGQAAIQAERVEKIETLAESTHQIVNSQRTAMEQALIDQRTAFERQLAELRSELHSAQLIAAKTAGAVEVVQAIKAQLPAAPVSSGGPIPVTGTVVLEGERRKD